MQFVFYAGIFILFLLCFMEVAVSPAAFFGGIAMLVGWSVIVHFSDDGVAVHHHLVEGLAVIEEALADAHQVNVVLAVLSGLAERGELKREAVAEAIRRYDVDPEAPDPWTT